MCINTRAARGHSSQMPLFFTLRSWTALESRLPLGTTGAGSHRGPSEKPCGTHLGLPSTPQGRGHARPTLGKAAPGAPALWQPRPAQRAARELSSSGTRAVPSHRNGRQAAHGASGRILAVAATSVHQVHLPAVCPPPGSNACSSTRANNGRGRPTVTKLPAGLFWRKVQTWNWVRIFVFYVIRALSGTTVTYFYILTSAHPSVYTCGMCVTHVFRSPFAVSVSSASCCPALPLPVHANPPLRVLLCPFSSLTLFVFSLLPHSYLSPGLSVLSIMQLFPNFLIYSFLLYLG